MNRLLPLAALEIFVWGVLLASTLLISRFVFAINLGTANLLQRVLTEIVRLLVSGTIMLTCLVVWKKLTDAYFWRTTMRKRSTSLRPSE